MLMEWKYNIAMFGIWVILVTVCGFDVNWVSTINMTCLEGIGENAQHSANGNYTPIAYRFHTIWTEEKGT